MAAIEVRLRRGTAAEVAAFTGAQGEQTYSTDTDEVRIHDGAAAGGLPIGVPVGTVAFFYQNAAPVGWTKDTASTLDDHCLRLVTSTGWSTGSKGATAFTSVFGSGKISGVDGGSLPAHTHNTVQVPGGTDLSNLTNNFTSAGVTGAVTSGAGGTHSHDLSMDINYINVIRATRV